MYVTGSCTDCLTIHAAAGTTLDIIKRRTMATMYASSSYGTYLFAV